MITEKHDQQEADAPMAAPIIKTGRSLQVSLVSDNSK